MAEWYRNRGPPGPADRIENPIDPIDLVENSRQGALVHTGLVLIRLMGADMHQDEQELRQLCLTVWTHEAMQLMTNYLISSVDFAPSTNEQEAFGVAMEGRLVQPQNADREGALLHAGFAVVRLQGGGFDDLARAIRQSFTLIWDDETVQQMLTYVTNHHRMPTAREQRRYFAAMGGIHQGRGTMVTERKFRTKTKTKSKPLRSCER